MKLPLTALVAAGIAALPSVLLTGASAWAAAPAAQEQRSEFSCGQVLSAEEGRSSVRRAQEAYRSLKSLRASFIQESRVAALDTAEEAIGKVSFLAPGKMKWEYQSPDQQIFLVRDRTVWLYQVAERQVVIDEISKLVLTELPVAFLMGLGDLEKEFRLDRACRTTAGIALEFSAALTSGSRAGAEADPLRKFTLLIDAETALPGGARVIDVSGNSTTIRLSRTEANPVDLSDKAFAANFPAGVDVSDRRPEAESRELSERDLDEGVSGTARTTEQQNG